MPRRRSRPILAPGVIASFLSALLLAPASASASVQTQWDTTPACVDATTIPSRVDALIDGPSEAPVLVSLGAEESDELEERWTISVRLHEGAAEHARTLRGRDCTTLTEAVALVVAVQLDAVASASSVPLQRAPSAARPPLPAEPRPAAPPQPRPPALTEPSSAMPASPSPPPAESRPKGSRLAVHLGAALGAELGLQPRHAASLELSAGLAWPHARLDAGALASAGPRSQVDALPEVGGRFLLLGGLVRGCGVIVRNRFALPLCGGIEAGDLRGSGLGVQRPRKADTLWFAVTAGMRPQWRVGRRVAVGGQLDLIVPLIRQRFSITDVGPVHSIPAVGARLGVTLRWSLR